MIDDGTKENGRDDIIVQDVAMHLLDALEGRGRRQVAPKPVSQDELYDSDRVLRGP
jgi:hypothetical protein